MQEVYPGIFVIKEKGALGNLKPEVNIYVIAGHDGIIYETGYGHRRSVKYLIKEINKIKEYYISNNEKFSISRIMVSHAHPDHFGGLKVLCKNLGAKIAVTRMTATIIKSKKNYYESFMADSFKDLYKIKNISAVIKHKILEILMHVLYSWIYRLKFIDSPDEILTENSEIRINGDIWKIFPSPGHSKDHISLYNEQKGILFSGDNIIHNVTTWLGPPNSDIEDYIKSLEYIRGLKNLSLILSSHGKPIHDPLKRIEKIIALRKKRNMQVLEIIEMSGKDGTSTSRIISRLYRKEGLIKHNLVRGWVVLSLKYLESNGYITRRIEKKKMIFISKKHSAAQ